MTKRFSRLPFPIKIHYTSAAEKILKKHDKDLVLNELVDFMDFIDADYAYVGASGSSLRVHLTWPPESKTQERRPR